MRITAGILMIIGGIIGGSFWQEFIPRIIPILLGFIAVWGGICALRRKSWGWALAGAICSILFPFFGIPAVILLVKRKGEFQASERTELQVWDEFHEEEIKDMEETHSSPDNPENLT